MKKCVTGKVDFAVEKGEKMNGKFKNRCRGITLIEILLILGLLAVITSFAAPTVGNATARADIRAAGENLQYSIRIARNAARMTESKVTMNILEEGQGGQGQRITFSVSEKGLKALGKSGLQEDRLPVDIKLVSDYSSYEFDSRGIVQNPGGITLVSRTDESLFTSFDIK